MHKELYVKKLPRDGFKVDTDTFLSPLQLAEPRKTANVAFVRPSLNY
jgi:hypothetical protein